MRKKRNSPSSRPHAALPPSRPIDALRRMLAEYAPDEPLGPPEGNDDVYVPGEGWSFPPRTRWPKCVFDTREKFPGYQPGYWYRENMKYGHCPADGAPLREWIAALLSHARAKWSGYIDGKQTKLQFVEWLPSYLGDDGLRWHAGTMDAAAECLRVKYGMPPMAPKGRGT
jgi:hypothetical protein